MEKKLNKNLLDISNKIKYEINKKNILRIINLIFLVTSNFF